MAPRHVAWKRRIGRIFSGPAVRRARSVILTHHAVGSGRASLPLDRFKEQTDWLARNARVVPVDALLESTEEHGLRVALTFDDGYACVATAVAPVLQQAALAATVFLNTACVGDTQAISSDERLGHAFGEKFLVWSEVRALHELGWSIGSHGADHVDLTRLQNAEVHAQLRESKAAIEGRLGAKCRQFAYTWGNHDARVRAAVAQCGYDLALAGVHGAVLPSSDHFAIPRIDIRSDYELEDFIAVVRGDWDYLGLVQKVRRLLP